MNVTGDRTAEHGLASVGYDDEGVAGQSWDLIRDGVLACDQLDRRMAALRGLAGRTAARSPTARATCRCSGWPTCHCSPRRAARPPRTSSRVPGDGIYILGDKSWSIDMQR